MAKKAKKRQEPTLVPPPSSLSSAPAIISASPDPSPATPATPPAPVSLPITSSASTPVPPVTFVAFREFIDLADLESVKLFLATAASTPEGQNLELLWDRAFEEGKRSLRRTLEKKLDDADNCGYKRGFEDGQSSKIKLFATGLEEGRADERSDWIAGGHGEHCFTAARMFEDSGIQTDPERVATVSMCTQTDVESTLRPPPPTPRSTPNTTNSAVQTITLTLPHSIPAPNPIHKTSPLPPMSLNWADEAESLPISPSLPPPRDFSVLRSSSPKPFASLQHRNKRSRAHLLQPFHNQQTFNMSRRNFSRRRFPPSSAPFWSDRIYPNRTPQFSLNWDRDPRLFELSRALNALGWVRP